MNWPRLVLITSLLFNSRKCPTFAADNNLPLLGYLALAAGESIRPAGRPVSQSCSRAPEVGQQEHDSADK